MANKTRQWLEEKFEEIYVQGNGKIDNLTDQMASHYLEVLEKTPSSLNTCLTAEDLNVAEPGSTVIIRGMVQDMLGQSYYLSAYKTTAGKTKWGLFMDEENEENIGEMDEDDTSLLRERHIFTMIGIPGQSDWVNQAARSNTNEPPPAKKKELDKSVESEEWFKKIRANIPANSIVASLLVYKDYDTVKLNDLVEIVGLVSNKDTAVPKIHVLAMRKLRHTNPLVPLRISDEEKSNLPETIRSDLISSLTSNFFRGDRLAAEFLLFTLLSSTYRREVSKAYGALHLNLCGCTKEMAQKITEYCRNVYPMVSYIPMSIEKLNAAEFVPKKDNEAERLLLSDLQLPQGAIVILDETQLDAGKLKETGLKNLASLKSVEKRQELMYDFQFQSPVFETDVTLLILSEGKSILQTEFVLKVQSGDENNDKMDADSSNLDAVRRYLTICRHSDYDILPAEQALIEQDFVDMRKADKSIQQSHLERYLLIARLMSISNGYSKLFMDTYQTAKQLEKQRCDRFK